MEKTLFIFRRDLRLSDNLGLNIALSLKKPVIACYIFEIDEPFSPRYTNFLLESLMDLEKRVKLYVFYGKKEKIVEKCIDDLNVNEVVFNRAYDPLEISKQKKIEKICKKKNVSLQIIDDALLHPPEETLKKDGTPYTIFTPYFKNAHKLPVHTPQKLHSGKFYSSPIDFENGKAYIKTLERIENPLSGGRDKALKMLKCLNKLKTYVKTRDFPAEDGVSHLSPFLNLGCISIREVYKKAIDTLGKEHEFIRALYWRDFFTHIGYFFPHVFKGAFHKKYDKLKWSYDKNVFKAWCEGKTGIPIVDAGMRELNETGLMHNRVRMIVASFLIKDLHIDWKEGEKYFEKTLIDFDLALNNGNWQWSASTGCDAQPYFRIFNPWLQQKKFDPDCIYIKKWVKELKDVPIKEIHSPKFQSKIVDHAKECEKALKLYRLAQKG